MARTVDRGVQDLVVLPAQDAHAHFLHSVFNAKFVSLKSTSYSCASWWHSFDVGKIALFHQVGISREYSKVTQYYLLIKSYVRGFEAP